MKKLSIKELQIKSFITSLDQSVNETIKGGNKSNPCLIPESNAILNGCHDGSCASMRFNTYDQANSIASCNACNSDVCV